MHGKSGWTGGSGRPAYSMKTYLRLLKYVKPYTMLLVISFLCSTVLSTISVSIIPIVGKLSDAIEKKNFTQLNVFIAAAIGLYILKGLFSFGQRYLIAHADQGITKDLRVGMFSHIQDLSLEFYSRTRTGEIVMIIMNDINMMQSAILESFTSIIPSIMTVSGISAYLFYLNWRLALISLLIFPLVASISTKFGKDMRRSALQIQEKITDISSLLHEVVTGAKVVKSFTMEKEEIKKFNSATDKMKQISLKVSVMKSFQVPLFSVIQTVAAAIVIWFGGFEIISGAITPSNLIAFFSGVIMLGDPLGDLSGINITIQMALISAQRYFRILDVKPLIKDSPDAVDVNSLEGAVTFKNVSFRYESSKTLVLKDVNISCNAGEAVAIVGHSGAGKSTLISLITRFYDVTKGSIMIDGRDIKEYKILSLRKFIGIVPQETLLFSGTIKENIAYGRIGATDEEVIRVAKMANADDFIQSFPDKYETMIGEKGIRLSGGERQRVAIARAFLRDPKILILDEATSSLDSESEHLVQEALEKLMKGRTTFVIAHRLSTVRFADRIIVINKGQIAEEGSHDKLMQLNGYYRKLYEMQLGKQGANDITDNVSVTQAGYV